MLEGEGQRAENGENAEKKEAGEYMAQRRIGGRQLYIHGNKNRQLRMANHRCRCSWVVWYGGSYREGIVCQPLRARRQAVYGR